MDYRKVVSISMNRKFKITIDVKYKDLESPHPSALLDSVQDNVEELLSPYGEAVETFVVSVEDAK